MADGLFTLVVLCIVMGTASFVAGILPLSFSLSPRQLRLITALGTGVLVGTSLIVIIPEGVDALYQHSPPPEHATRDALPLLLPVDVGRLADKHVGFVTGPDDGFGA
ncbi:ATX2-putative Golgi transporter, partial [Teratosphaeria destructans]